MKRFSATPLALSPYFLAACVTAGVTLPAIAAPNALCVDGECQPVISRVKHEGRDAYRLTDGRTEAVIVPSIGRIMRYGLVNGPNLLWNAPPAAVPEWSGWKNYGGDKMWLGPQKNWGVWGAKGGIWPPDAALDGQQGMEAEVLTGGKLRLTSPLSAATGIRFIREISYDTNGELIVEQTARKYSGPQLRGSIWSIAQVVPGEAVFIPANPNSPYKKNFHWLGAPKGEVQIDSATPSLLRLKPQPTGNNIKFGVDSPISAIVSVRDQTAFLLKTNKPKGDYPDGADEAGFPVEIYVQGDPRMFYMELELLSPLQNYKVGSRWVHTMRWSLHSLPSGDPNAPETVEAVQRIIEGVPTQTANS